jgi:hypothetical protein
MVAGVCPGVHRPQAAQVPFMKVVTGPYCAPYDYSPPWSQVGLPAMPSGYDEPRRAIQGA